MPMTLNGSGTIGGLSPGGLPDASVTQADLAANVTSTGPVFRVGQSGVVGGFTSGAFTKVTFDTVIFDTHTAVSSSRFQPTIAGYYFVCGSIQLNTTNGLSAIFKNGTVYEYGQHQPATTSISKVGTLVYLNGTTDYVELHAYQASGSTVSISGGVPSVNFSGNLVRAA